MTEDQAKTKWCPFTRVGEQASGAAENRPDGSYSCIGSACMAFRWVPDIQIAIGSNRIAVLSAEDAPLEAGGYWWAGSYAKNDFGYLHRHIAAEIWGPIPRGIFVDHIDGDPLNCRRHNLRLVTPAQNAANSASRGGKSKHRGVFAGRNGRWASQISKAGVRLHLGTFDTEDEAAMAYDTAAADIHGEFARRNLSPKVESGRQGFCGLAGAPQ